MMFNLQLQSVLMIYNTFVELISCRGFCLLNIYLTLACAAAGGVY